MWVKLSARVTWYSISDLGMHDKRCMVNLVAIYEQPRIPFQQNYLNALWSVYSMFHKQEKETRERVEKEENKK